MSAAARCSPFLQVKPTALPSCVTSAVTSGRQATSSAAVFADLPPPTKHKWVSTSILLGAVAGVAWWRADSDPYSSTTAPLIRTGRAVWWGAESAVAYKLLAVQGLEPEAHKTALQVLHCQRAQQLLQLCKANGGVYVKAGQLLSLSGGVPKPYQEALSQLQDRAEPVPVGSMLRVIEQDLGLPAHKVFRDFSLEATAAASIAQVHRATLPSGQTVAVKVQYPAVRATAAADLATFTLLSRLAAAAFPDWAQLGWVVEEVRGKLEKELDFTQEVTNAERLKGLMSTERVAVPRVYQHLSSSRVITMEWIDGCKISDTDTLRRQGINPRQVALDLLGAFAEMTYVHGLVHGDPHPGNILVRPKGRPRWVNWLLRGSFQAYDIVLLDHGSYLELEPLLRSQYCRLWCAFVVDDMEAARQVASEMAGEKMGVLLPAVLTQRLKSREQAKALRQSMGLHTLKDFTQLLEEAPRGLLEALRIAAVVRGVSSLLGASLSDRLHINGMYALRGMPRPSGGGAGQPDGRGEGAGVGERARDALYRVHMRVRLMAIQMLLRARDTVRQAGVVLACVMRDGREVAALVAAS